MASKTDIDFTYTLIDRIFRSAMGEMADISGAYYDGDYSLTLEQAQKKKHEFIFNSLKLKPGDRVLDMGCGWGPMLNYLRSKGVKATGLTLSAGQAKACKKNGLDVHVRDCRNLTPDVFGKFDAVISLGAFEHFCSLEQYKEGKQDAIYSQFFKTVSDLIPSGGRFFLQTMVFGKTMIPPEYFDIGADPLTDAYVCAQMMKLFPGSWLPHGDQHILKLTDPLYRMVSKSSGRLDYIETIKEWNKRYSRFTLGNILMKISLAPRFLFSKEFRQAFTPPVNSSLIVFERELFDHYRIVFEKK